VPTYTEPLVHIVFRSVWFEEYVVYGSVVIVQPDFLREVTEISKASFIEVWDTLVKVNVAVVVPMSEVICQVKPFVMERPLNLFTWVLMST
jgi:hypothetical protein